MRKIVFNRDVAIEQRQFREGDEIDADSIDPGQLQSLLYTRKLTPSEYLSAPSVLR